MVKHVCPAATAQQMRCERSAQQEAQQMQLCVHVIKDITETENHAKLAKPAPPQTLKHKVIAYQNPQQTRFNAYAKTDTLVTV